MHAAENPATRSHRGPVVRSGIAFELEGEHGLSFESRETHCVHSSARLHLTRSGRYDGGRSIGFTRDARSIVLTTGGARLELHAGPDDEFEGSATIPVDHPHPVDALVLGSALAIAHARHGAVLHAAVAAVDRRAFVFVGPSGAGKSTACRLLVGASELAADRVLVLEVAGTTRAYRLPGGEPTGLPEAADGLPIDRILRVRREASRVGCATMSAGAAFATLRAAILLPEGTDEADAITAIDRLRHTVPVQAIYTRLGVPIDPANLR